MTRAFYPGFLKPQSGMRQLRGMGAASEEGHARGAWTPPNGEFSDAPKRTPDLEGVTGVCRGVRKAARFR